MNNICPYIIIVLHKQNESKGFVKSVKIVEQYYYIYYNTRCYSLNLKLKNSFKFVHTFYLYFYLIKMFKSLFLIDVHFDCFLFVCFYCLTFVSSKNKQKESTCKNSKKKHQ
jgi:hypothetical protein